MGSETHGENDLPPHFESFYRPEESHELINYIFLPIYMMDYRSGKIIPLNKMANLLKIPDSNVIGHIYRAIQNMKRSRGVVCPFVSHVHADGAPGEEMEGARHVDVLVLPSERICRFYLVIRPFPCAFGSAEPLVGWCGLTRREVAVAVRVACGRTLSDIAAEFGISVGTVRNHLKAVFQKLGLGRQSELVARLLPLLLFGTEPVLHRGTPSISYPREPSHSGHA